MISQIDESDQSHSSSGNRSFDDKADRILRELYLSSEVTTISEKIALLCNKLGTNYNFHSADGEVTDESKLGCLEYEYLFQQGIIQARCI